MATATAATAAEASVRLTTKGELPGGVNEKCYAEIPLHSPGLWGLPNASLFLDFNLPLLLLQLAVIFILTQALHLVLKRIRLPRLISEILVFPFPSFSYLSINNVQLFFIIMVFELASSHGISK